MSQFCNIPLKRRSIIIQYLAKFHKTQPPWLRCLTREGQNSYTKQNVAARLQKLNTFVISVAAAIRRCKDPQVSVMKHFHPDYISVLRILQNPYLWDRISQTALKTLKNTAKDLASIVRHRFLENVPDHLWYWWPQLGRSNTQNLVSIIIYMLFWTTSVH